MSKRKVFLHIGYPKTATTFLQRDIFPLLQDKRYLGRHDGLKDSIPFINVLTEAVTFASERSFEARVESVGKLLEQEEQKRYEHSGNDALLISDEGLLFRTLMPFEIPWYNVHYAADLDRLIRRLKQLFDRLSYDLKMIVTLRNQPDIIHSLYAEKYYYYQNFDSLNSFDKYVSNGFSDLNYTDYGLCNLEYDKTIEVLRKHFSARDFLILKYEDIGDNPALFFNDLLGFTESQNPVSELVQASTINLHNARMLEENRKKANYKVGVKNDPVLRLLSRSKKMIYGSKNIRFRKITERVVSLRSKKHLEINLSQEQRNFMTDWYKASNKRLAAIDSKFESYL